MLELIVEAVADVIGDLLGQRVGAIGTCEIQETAQKAGAKEAKGEIGEGTGAGRFAGYAAGVDGYQEVDGFAE